MFSYACSIPDPDSDTVVLIGGGVDSDLAAESLRLVERYGHSGLVETLPSHRFSRKKPGCGSYYKNGNKVNV